ncbi:hypothetical protein AN403_5260 [Pseudomonas fluorescens]|uniref:Uncharacterized protein n=1 Tax=Pseudomonas fluorescens TaxID=294 RepID=A0A0P8XL07_PSEFL|nr:hypothetical protein AN403_5260 [Pseudomonas fluorescens]
MNHILAAGSFMQVIDVLSYDCQLGNVFSKICYREVCSIRL